MRESLIPVKITRRKFLHSMAGFGVTSTKWLRSAPPLRIMGERDHLKVGVAAQHSMLSDPTLVAFVTSQCSVFTPAREFGWGTIHPAPDRYDFREADWMMQFVAANDFEAHGHTLCWNDWNPSWLNTGLTSANAEQVLTSHINTILNRYHGQFATWDVVNEPIRTGQGNPDGLSSGPWLPPSGPTTSRLPLKRQHRQTRNPFACLTSIRSNRMMRKASTTGTLRSSLSSACLRKRFPCRQSDLSHHLSGVTPARSKAMIAFIREIKSMGLTFMITEMDVNDTAMPGDDDTRGSGLTGSITLTISRKCSVLTPPMSYSGPRLIKATTGIAWLRKWSMYRRADGRKHHPGILDADMSPNPALAGIRAALSHTAYAPQESRRGA